MKQEKRDSVIRCIECSKIQNRMLNGSMSLGQLRQRNQTPLLESALHRTVKRQFHITEDIRNLDLSAFR